MTRDRMAVLWARLMGFLGYEHFGAHGSDIGAEIIGWPTSKRPTVSSPFTP